MEEQIVEVLKNYYPGQTPVRDDYPTIKKIQAQIWRWYRDDRIGHFINRIEKEYGEKCRFDRFTPHYSSPSFGFKIVFIKGTVLHHLHFYFSILSPHFCYFIKSHKITKHPDPPTDLEEKAFYEKLSEMINKEKINIVDHFYLDENLSLKIDALTVSIANHSDKYQLSVNTWQETKMYKWMRAHADSHEDYAVTIYGNDTPEILQNEVDFILQTQKEYIDFTLLPTHLIEKDVPYNPRSTPTFCQLLFGYDVPDKRTKLL